MAQAQDPSQDRSQKPNAADETPEEIVIEDDEIVVEEAPTGASATSTATLTDEKVESTPGRRPVPSVSSTSTPRLLRNRGATDSSGRCSPCSAPWSSPSSTP